MNFNILCGTKPVVVGLSGGLGNQMFQYAAGKALSLRLSAPLVLDLTWFGGQEARQFALDPFCIEVEKTVQFSWLPPKPQALASRFSRRFFPNLMGVPVCREPHFHYDPEFASLSRPVFLEGYWQSERYFQEIRLLLLREFSLNYSMPTKCVELLNQIRSCEAICVHVRRGDYLSNPLAAQLHGTCSVSYYHAATNELSEGLTSPHCFVFSDDPHWVRASLNFDCPMTIVDVNGPEGAHLDLVLMAACHHYIIANSSLSWWGAWLGSHPTKKVVAPVNWFLTPDNDTRDLLPKTWLRR